ncbi:MAG: glycosyltransferase family 2 protein [Pseudomonadota bacterium]
MRLSIIIPVFNECRTLPVLISRIEAMQIEGTEKEIIFVDDGSTDGSREYLDSQKERYRVVFLGKNKGKGTAVRAGIEVASGDYVLIQDADLEYDPEDIPRLVSTAVKESLLVVYGSRILNPDNRRHSSALAYIGGRALTLVTNLLFGLQLTDEPTCYKLFDRALLASLPLKARRFEFCPEVTAKVARKGIKIKEIPIRYNPRTWAEGKKIRWPDFFHALWVLIRERFGASI